MCVCVFVSCGIMRRLNFLGKGCCVSVFGADPLDTVLICHDFGCLLLFLGFSLLCHGAKWFAVFRVIRICGSHIRLCIGCQHICV